MARCKFATEADYVIVSSNHAQELDLTKTFSNMEVDADALPTPVNVAISRETVSIAVCYVEICPNYPLRQRLFSSGRSSKSVHSTD